jgi:methylase of polypeptide subunit release factors
MVESSPETRLAATAAAGRHGTSVELSPAHVPDPLEPSEYTALLIQALHLRADQIRGASVFEIGVGSGVVLKAMATLGATRISGVDIEEHAVRSAQAMLAGLPGGVLGSIGVSDMWEAVAGQRFDLIVANLPHFPAEHLNLPTRLPSWSTGGVDGRRLLDRFLDGLDVHLAANGIALLTHNGFVDVELSRLRLAATGFVLSPVLTVFVHIGGEKLARLSPTLRARFDGGSLHQYGRYLFGEVHVIEIARLRPDPGCCQHPDTA